MSSSMSSSFSLAKSTSTLLSQSSPPSSFSQSSLPLPLTHSTTDQVSTPSFSPASKAFASSCNSTTGTLQQTKNTTFPASDTIPSTLGGSAAGNATNHVNTLSSLALHTTSTVNKSDDTYRSASDCIASANSWYAARRSYESKYEFVSTDTETWTNTLTKTLSTHSLTTIGTDFHALGSESIIGTVTSTTTSTETATWTVTPSYAGTFPTCWSSISPDDCLRLKYEASSEWAAWKSGHSSIQFSFYSGYGHPGPLCNTQNTFLPQTHNCTPCTIWGSNVELFYWPMTMTPSNSNKTASPNVIGVLTAVVGDNTYTSPTVYISFTHMEAVNDCSQHVGGEYSGTILSMHPDSVSSMGVSTFPDGLEFREDAFPFNYADLNKPIRGSVYRSQPRCIRSGCDIIYDDYAPILSVPAEVRAWDSMWKDCVLPLHGLVSMN